LSSGIGLQKGVKKGWQGSKDIDFYAFHGVFLRSQHEIWSKQHNRKVSRLQVLAMDLNQTAIKKGIN
jgi:hypothetical protein